MLSRSARLIGISAGVLPRLTSAHAKHVIHATCDFRVNRVWIWLGKRGCVDMTDIIPASEFTRNFGRYRMLAQREAVAVSSHGSITGYFVAPDEYEEFQRFKQRRRSFATAELPDDKMTAIGASRMDARHAHLDAMLDPK
jgi:hypothetical protein